MLWGGFHCELKPSVLYCRKFIQSAIFTSVNKCRGARRLYYQHKVPQSDIYTLICCPKILSHYKFRSKLANVCFITKALIKFTNTRKYPFRRYILGVLTHTTALDQLWGGDEILTMWF